MRAVWLSEGEIEVRDVADPTPAPDEALVRVTRAGICNTDLELVRGYYPFDGIPGHEFCGVVVAGPTELEGARVVGEINAVCGRCDACRGGRASHCERRTVLGIQGRDGAFAETLALPAANLHRVPDAVPDDVACCTEPLAAALRIGEQIDLDPATRVAVVGPGKLGQLVARSLLARVPGCDLTVIGRREASLAALRELGIRCVLTDAVAADAFDVVIDCTGAPGGFALARHAVRPAGTIVVKSTYAGTLDVDLSSLVVDEITLVGSRCGPFAPALELLASGAVDPTDLIDARYPLERAIEAFDHAARPGALKVLLEIG